MFKLPFKTDKKFELNIDIELWDISTTSMEQLLLLLRHNIETMAVKFQTNSLISCLNQARIV